MFSRVLPRESVRSNTEEEARTATDHRSSVIRSLSSTIFWSWCFLIIWYHPWCFVGLPRRATKWSRTKWWRRSQWSRRWSPTIKTSGFDFFCDAGRGGDPRGGPGGSGGQGDYGRGSRVSGFIATSRSNEVHDVTNWIDQICNALPSAGEPSRPAEQTRWSWAVRTRPWRTRGPWI